MVDTLFAVLSPEYSGLLIAGVLLVVFVLLFRVSRGTLKRALFGVLSLGSLVLAIGSVTHLLRVAAVKRDHPPPGELFDVGGYRMHVLAEGPDSGGPPVVWLGGGHAGGLVMMHLHDLLKERARSILVDRPGSGWSEVGPFPRTTALEVEEVLAALRASGEPGPYIFAGHSFGGLLSINIARRYPEETAAIAMLDATPLDVIFYGLDRTGLSTYRDSMITGGLRRLFGFYQTPPDNGSPMDALFRLYIQAGQNFSTASIFEELTPEGLIDRAFETVVFDGELGDLPLYLIAPGDDPTTQPYAESVAGAGEKADRFVAFLKATRERYMATTSNATRIYTPAGTGHVFPDQEPQFVVDTLLDIVGRHGGTPAEAGASYEALTTRWPGPYGGLPPVDLATPADVEAAFRRAVEEKSREVDAIASNPAPPTFENTIEALDRSGVALSRIQALLGIFVSTATSEEWGKVAGQTAPLSATLESEIAHNAELFARVQTVYEALPASAPDEQASRLVSVIRERMLHQGAALSDEQKARLGELNGKLAELRTTFARNASMDEAKQVVFVEDPARLNGLPEPQLAAAKKAAEDKDRPDAWAIPISRPSVWPVLTNVDDRSLRQEVWRLWAKRGGNDGELDNRPVTSEILKLRGEKAKLLGYPTFAHYQTSVRMAGSPETAMDLMMSAWERLLIVTENDLAKLQAIADTEGADFTLQPWDRLYYAEKYRQQTFNLSAEDVLPYLSMDNVIDAMFHTAKEVYGFSFRELDDVAVVSPDIRVFEVSRAGEVTGVIWMDLYARPGKGPASWASQYRAASDLTGRSLPLVALHSAAQKPDGDGLALLPWERANVIFHEFGHTLQTLSNTSAYPSLGALNAPWDFIEVPALLHERWLIDGGLLERFARHHETGEPIPADLLARLKQSLNYDRVFSATLNFLGTSIVDMRLHLLADGRDIDVVATEKAVLEELKMPQAVDLILYSPHAFHTFATEQYPAAVYTYLWSDVIAADIGSVFLDAPGGLYDQEVAAAYRDQILDPGNAVDVATAVRRFLGRDPDPDALMRRFGLLP
ncbi:MAG: alpha/beta fold hydrolase [Pseudomonadota bacterium]